MGKVPQINSNTQILRNDEIISTEMDDQLIMLSVENGEYYGINHVGRHIWELIATPMKVSDICLALGRKFNVTPDRCREEVLSFLNQMAGKDIVKIV